MSLLPARLFNAAVSFSSAVKEAGGSSILMGGAASIALGNTTYGRETKDLDFNLPTFTPQMMKVLVDKGIGTSMLDARADRFSANIPESAPGVRDATSIDLAVKPDTTWLIGRFTKEIEGITVADERLLLVDKIRCFADRSDNQDKKLLNDLEDIMFCVSQIDKAKQTIPPELKQLISQESWDKFWPRLKERAGTADFGVYVEYLHDIGLN